MAVAASKKRPSAGVKSRNVVAEARGRGKPSRGRGAMRELVTGILPVIAIFLLIRTFLVEAFRIPSGSMEPTLLVGDFLFVNKLAYGPHIPFTDVNLPGYSEPRRGDIAIYESPPQQNTVPPEALLDDLTPTVVKRIVAVAGDTAHMRGGLLFVNGIAQRQGYGAVARPAEHINAPNPYIQWTTERGVRGTRFGNPPSRATLEDWGPIVVPAGHVFTLGDNRYNSIDGRYYGFVPRQNLRGRPLFIYYSHDCAASGGMPLCLLTTIRWDRIGDRIR
jgi:signal peptidase I